MVSLRDSFSAEPLEIELVFGGCDGFRKLVIVVCLLLAWDVLICESSESELVVCFNGCLLSISSALMEGLPTFLTSLVSSSTYTCCSANSKYGLSTFFVPFGLPTFRLGIIWSSGNVSCCPVHYPYPRVNSGTMWSAEIFYPLVPCYGINRIREPSLTSDASDSLFTRAN